MTINGHHKVKNYQDGKTASAEKESGGEDKTARGDEIGESAKNRLSTHAPPQKTPRPILSRHGANNEERG